MSKSKKKRFDFFQDKFLYIIFLAISHAKFLNVEKQLSYRLQRNGPRIQPIFSFALCGEAHKRALSRFQVDS